MATLSLDNLRSEVSVIDTTQLDGDFFGLTYLQFTGAASGQWAKDKLLPKSMYALWSQASEANLKAMGLEKIKIVGAPTVFLRGFSDTDSRSYEECNFSLTMKQLPLTEGQEVPQQLHKLGRFQFVNDDRAIWRGIGQGPLSQYVQLEIRLIELEEREEDGTVITDDKGNPVMETWCVLGYIG
jgi:hypothetical protein